jgi:glycosyltransferase involved in cell wall biosynthesis
VDPERVTAVILTRDEERNLPRAMTSLPHGMPVLVVDAQSDDGTVAFAIGAGARVIERPWTDFVEARRFAISQVKTPWLLQLDADEALDDVLRDAVLSCDGAADGYAVSRTTYFSGKPMRMWSDERLLRLVRTADVRVEEHPVTGGDTPLHERLTCSGQVRDLAGVLLHYSYDDRTAYQDKFQRYTSIEARGCSASAANALVSALLVLPRLVKNLVARGAVLDGTRGWYVAWYSALYPAVVAWKAILRSTGSG